MATTLGPSASHLQITLFSNRSSIIRRHPPVLNGPAMDFPRVLFPGCIILLLLSFLMVRVRSFCSEGTLTKCLGSVLVAGSNPNSDYVDSGIPYPTEYRVEKFYPPYFKQRRPSPTGIPSSLQYGGAFFNLSLSSGDLSEDAENVNHSKVVVMRTGFSTHAMVRTEVPLICHFQLSSTHRTWGNDLSNSKFLTLRTRTVQEFSIVAIFHPTQPSSHQALLVSVSSCLPLSTPESLPVVLFVVVNGVPSIGNLVMVGSGKIDQQDVLPPAPLPAPSIAEEFVSSAAGGDRKKTSFARPMQAEISWSSVLTWTLGTGFWLLLF